MTHIIFYQNEICHHKSPYIRSLAGCDDIKVSMAADTDVQPYRKAMGLSRADYGRTDIMIPGNREDMKRFVGDTEKDSIHVVEGTRAGFASRHGMRSCLNAGRRLVLFTEPGDHRGVKGMARRLLYHYEAMTWRRSFQCILATGKLGVDWFVHSGYPREYVFPFCYAVDGPDTVEAAPEPRGAFQIVYCGQLIHRKNITLLIRALKENSHVQWRLSIVGDGPMRRELTELAGRLGIAHRIKWHRILSNADATAVMSRADLLVLPSRFDGWGAVVNEALMAGTPVICSDTCGASDLLLDDWRGEVFRSGSLDSLAAALHARIAAGVVTNAHRMQIVEWARQTISGGAIAEYFLHIMAHIYNGAEVPVTPWYIRVPRPLPRRAFR